MTILKNQLNKLLTLEWYHPHSNIGHSQLQSPLQEDQIITIHKQDTAVKVPEIGVRLKYSPWTTETQEDCIIRVRKTITFLMAHPFPTSAQHHINRAPLGLQFLPWEKENPEWTSSLPSTAGPFLGDPLKYYITRITKESEELKREAKQHTDLQFSSVVQSCLTLCDPMDCSMPGFPVHHQHLELAEIHVQWVGDAIQQFHPLSSPFSPAFNLSQHQGLFHWVSSSHQVAKVSEFQLQRQSVQWIFRTYFL